MIISNPHVMQSHAGYYVGSSYYDEELGGDFPYCRMSGYFDTVQEAEKYLACIYEGDGLSTTEEGT